MLASVVLEDAMYIIIQSMILVERVTDMDPAVSLPVCLHAFLFLYALVALCRCDLGLLVVCKLWGISFLIHDCCHVGVDTSSLFEGFV